MISKVQQSWIETFLLGPGQTLSPDAVEEPKRVGTKGATIRILNGTGANLKLVSSSLMFPKTARFAPPPPAIVPGRDGTLHEEAVFNVVDSDVGSAHAGGSAQYHIERKISNAFFSFSWSGGKANIHVDDPYSTALHSETDSEAGDYYEFVLHDYQSNDQEIQVDILNQSGLDMTLASATLDDPAHSEFEVKPPTQIKNGLPRTFFVQAFDPDHAEAAGTVIYTLTGGDKPRTAKMSWVKDGRPIGVMDPNDGAFIIESTGKERHFDFVVKPHAGPPPSIGGDSKVTIINHSGYELTDMFILLDGKSAKLKSQPAPKVPDGGSTSFEVVSDDPHAPETDGFIAYDLDFANDQLQDKPTNIALSWRTNDPPITKVVPEKSGFSVQATQSGNDTTFVVTGPALDFAPPEKPRQPTLRQGDNTTDGWVEYLQESLNHHLNANLEINGNFGPETHKQVIAFQNKHKKDGCMVDGIVGNQTWAFLREGMPEKPSTDGRKPHSFKEQGQEARWVREHGVVTFDAGRDALVMQLVSVGDADQMKDRKVRVRITAPDKSVKVEDCPIGPPISTSKTGQGDVHEVLVTPFTRLFDPPQQGDFQVESYFDTELGGDSFSETVNVPAA